jgi:DNA-binding transcriptional LysR family regulator
MGVPRTISLELVRTWLCASMLCRCRPFTSRHGHCPSAASRRCAARSPIVRELALSGVGIALRSLWDVGDALATGRLVPVLPGWEGPRDLAIHAVHPRAPAVPAAVTAFVAFLRDTLDPPPWERGSHAGGDGDGDVAMDAVVA